MPLEVRRLSASIILVLLSIVGISAQTPPPSSVTQTNTLPTSADVMRTRISKAKAYVATKNYAAAIYELEGIKREINEPSVNNVVQVMLMNCYLEQMDYTRAQKFLTEIFNAQKANKPNTNYFAVAGQVVKGARIQLERYRSLGLSVADRNLPPEAAADVNKMRETVEMVVVQSKTLGNENKLTADSMALLQEATTARGNLARDDYDAKRWKDEVADARETLANSRSKVINAVDDGANVNPINSNNSVASNQNPPVIPKVIETTSQIVPVATENKIPTVENNPVNSNISEPPTVAKKDNLEKKVEEKTLEINNQVAQNTTQRETRIVKQDPPKVEETPVKPETQIVKDASPLQIGSLIEYATERVNPTYPPAARTVRITGIVKIEVVVNEEGKVEVQNTSGPSMLQRAALDAIKKWKFKPFMRDGQPVKATGYVNFNFNL
jgi:TonB family protein